MSCETSPEILYMEHESLVYYCFNQIKSHIPDNQKDDVLQDGRLILWKCCCNFNVSKRVRFSSYACIAIIRRMNEGMLERLNYSNNGALKKHIQSPIKAIPFSCLESKYREKNSHGTPFWEAVDDHDDFGTANAHDEFEFMLTLFPEKLQRVIRMRLEGIHNEKIAQTLGVHPVTLDGYLRQINRRLADYSGIKIRRPLEQFSGRHEPDRRGATLGRWKTQTEKPDRKKNSQKDVA